MAGLSEVMRSDLARWKILSEEGGWWSDFDILYIRPLWDSTRGISVLGAYQKDRANGLMESIGFLGSSIDEFAKDFYKEVLHNAKVNCNLKKYQSAGRFAFAPVLNNWINDNRVCMLPYEIVYPVQSWEARYLYSNFDRELTLETIGIHWYGGFKQSQEFEKKVNKDNLFQQQGWLADKFKERLAKVHYA